MADAERAVVKGPPVDRAKIYLKVASDAVLVDHDGPIRSFEIIDGPDNTVTATFVWERKPAAKPKRP